MFWKDLNSVILSFNNKLKMTEEIKDLSEQEFLEVVKKGFVFVDFWAAWCMPCLMMSPILEELNKEFKGKVRFVKVNVDQYQQLAIRYGISSIPNMILFKDGQPVDRFIGTRPKDVLKEEIEKHLD